MWGIDNNIACWVTFTVLWNETPFLVSTSTSSQSKAMLIREDKHLIPCPFQPLINRC